MDEVVEKFNKATGDSGFDEGNKYRFTMKRLEICKFAELFFKIEEFSSSFQKFCKDCHDSHGNKISNLYRTNLYLLDIRFSFKN
ncbi:8097_t:CDS:2 [Scutellospora calospora]|uniref:8097_t:CDS:1 n=1 Tax=Scutellospora calospora TaxID=85575 RepID=A0ACA9KAH8_9GLOM|nr:8097_t:CDS:2 [Scutellospora calospora]